MRLLSTRPAEREGKPVSTEERVRILREAEPNSWIALSGDESRLVASGSTYGEAVERAELQGESNPVLIKTPDSWLPQVLAPCA